MECGDEYNIVPVLECIIAFPLKLPISVVDKDEYAWTADDGILVISILQ